jgi:hypothetical protein
MLVFAITVLAILPSPKNADAWEIPSWLKTGGLVLAKSGDNLIKKAGAAGIVYNVILHTETPAGKNAAIVDYPSSWSQGNAIVNCQRLSAANGGTYITKAGDHWRCNSNWN